MQTHPASHRKIPRAVMAPFIVAFVLLNSARAQKPEDIEAEIRKAQKESSRVLVVIDAQGKYEVFPVSGIAEVVKNKITLKADTYSIGDATGDYPPEKMAEILIKKWKEPPPAGNRWGIVDKDGKMVSGEIGRLKKDLRLEIKRVVLSSIQK